MTMGWNELGRHAVLATLVATACEVKTVGDLEGGSESSGSEGSGSESSSQSFTSNYSDTSGDPTDATATVSATVGNTESESSSDSESESDTETTGACPPEGSMCDPQPMLAPGATDWSIDDFQGFDVELVDVRCTVADFQDDGFTMTIELHCEEEELAQHTLVLPHNDITPLNLGMGSSVLLTYHAQTPFWTNYWFALRRLDGALVIGAAEADTPLPVDDLFAPLTVEVRDDVCPQECVDEPDACGTTIRHALDIGLAADEMTVYDGNSDVIGQPTSYAVLVGRARGFVDFGVCTDIPGAWYSLIVYDTSEG